MAISGSERGILNAMNPAAQRAKLGDKVFYASSGYMVKPGDNQYFVDASVQVSGDGLSWETAYKTIDEAIDKARYKNGTTTIEGDDGNNKDRRKFVWIWPGQYNEQLLFSGYNISVCGVMPINQCNGDWGGVVINYDAAVTTTCVMGFTGAGIELSNLWIHNAAAIPTLYVPSPGDGCWVHDCFFDGDGTLATYGIQWLDCRNSTISNNKIMGHVTAEIAVGNGGATWFRNSAIVGNHISTAATSGIIVVAATICGASDGSIIHQNTIVGTATTGIHQDSAGAYVLVSDNWIQASTAVTDDGTGACDNHTAS